MKEVPLTFTLYMSNAYRSFAPYAQ